MAHSGTLTLPAAEFLTGSQGPAATGDPITDACVLLRTACHLPFQQAVPQRWLSCFQETVIAARRAVATHILRSERDDSMLNLLQRSEPRLRAEAERQLAEHAEIMHQIHGLADEASSIESPDLWCVIDFSEKAMRVEMALARHHNRYAQLVYEAENRELGGEEG